MTIITNNATASLTDGLSLSTTNVLINQVPIITDPGTDEIPANISDPDHSLNYTCGTSVGDFAVSYGPQVNISYVAISGHTAATPTQATIELYNDTTLIDSVILQRNNNVMFTFPSQTFQDLIIKFVTVPNNFQMTVSYIAAGQHLTLTYGEQAGYKRSWLMRHLTQRTTTNLQVGPVSTTQKSKAMKGVLTLPNEFATFVEGTWQTFIDFSYEQPFFIKEISSKPESTYICFDPKFNISAHSSTRTLDVSSLSFTLFNGMA